MLKKFNTLEPFFEDCYRRIGVREYARLAKVSPPTASKLLDSCSKEGLLLKSIQKNNTFFFANKESADFINFSRIYWSHRLKPIIDRLGKKLINPTIILFGSLSKAEVKPDSDIDIVVFSIRKDIDMKDLEKKLKRKIQIFWFESASKIKNKELASNILNGYVLAGRIVI